MIEREVINGIDAGVVVVDARLRIGVWNAWMEEVSEVLASSAVGKNLIEVFPGLCGSRVENAIKNCLDNRLPSYLSRSLNRAPFPLKSKLAEKSDFDFMQQSVKIVPLELGADGPKCLIQIMDVTNDAVRERKLRSQSRELATASERTLNHATEKLDFLATMSHEIRSPIGGIAGMIKLLQGTRVDSEQKEYIENIDRMSEGILRILNDFLDVSKLDAGKVSVEPERFSLAEELKTVLATYQVQADEKNVQLKYEFSSNVPTEIVTDKNLLRQILVNLVGNAVKFTDNGEVVASVRTIDLGQGRNGLKFEISDTGIGVSKEMQAALFGRYVQAKDVDRRNFSGTGLGLSICKELTELLGGSIELESELGSGSKFTFTIECLEETEQEPASEVVSDEVKSLDVLVAEDQPINQLYITKILEGAGHKVTMAENGLEAVKAFANGAFDLVFMDLQMPVLDGIEATKRIRQISQTVPIFAVTANIQMDNGDKCHQAGMNGILLKPVMPADLLETIAKVASINKPGDDEVEESTMDEDRDLTETLNLVYLKQMGDTLGAETLGSFLSRLPDETGRLIGEIKDALEKGELDQAGRTAHALKGVANQMGAKALADIAARLETSEILEDDLQELNDARDVAMVDIDAYLKQQAG